jgi:hypothetical protein
MSELTKVSEGTCQEPEDTKREREPSVRVVNGERIEASREAHQEESRGKLPRNNELDPAGNEEEDRAKHENGIDDGLPIAQWYLPRLRDQRPQSDMKDISR